MKYLNPKQCRHPYTLREGAARPDMFVFTMDMVTPDFYREPSAYRSHLRMPAWGRLERDSVCFDNAFSTSPLCGPSRAALFTGRYSYVQVNEERAHDGFEVEVKPGDAIYPEYLKAAGYLTAHIGKSHIGVETFVRAFGESCSPWNRWAPPVYDDPEYHQYLQRLGVKGFRFQREIRGLKVDRRTPGNRHGGWLVQEDGSQFPMAATYAHYCVDRAIGHLDSLLLRRRESAAPIYLHVDLFEPHQPFLIPAGLEAQEAELRRTVRLPEGYLRWRDRGFTPREHEPHIYETYRRNWGLYDEHTALDYLIAHMLQMEVIDRALALFLDALEARGLYRDGLVMLSSDHGEMNLEEGLLDKGAYGHPKVGRVPLLMKLPGGAGAGRHVDPPVCLLDVAPALLDQAGVQVPASWDGESLMDRLVPGDPGRRKPFVFESGWHIAPGFAVAIQLYEGPAAHYRYVYNTTSPHDELYDMNDPTYRNLIADPAFQPVVDRALAALQQIFHGDARWRCYRQSFDLEKAERLSVTAGDNQMFIPE